MREVQETDRVRALVDFGSTTEVVFTVRSIRIENEKAFIEYSAKRPMELPTVKKQEAGADAPILILRPGLCEKPVCELHLRRVDAECVYCAAHWNAWEGVT